jgi:hypothetical protein
VPFFPVEHWLLTGEYRAALGNARDLYYYIGLGAPRRYAKVALNIADAARTLGVSRRMIYYWLDRLAHPAGDLAPLVRILHARGQRHPIVQLTSPPECWPVWKRIGGPR